MLIEQIQKMNGLRNIGYKLLWEYIIIISLTLVILGCGNSEQKANAKSEFLKLDPVLEKVSFSLAMLQSDMSLQKDYECMFSQVSKEVVDTPKTPRTQKKESGGIWDWLWGGEEQQPSIDQKPELNVDEIIDNILLENKNYCEVYTLVEKETHKVFDKIIEAKKVTDELYTFSVFIPDSEDDIQETFREHYIGVFNDIKICNKFALFAVNKNIPIRKCRLWNPEDIW